MTFKLEKYKEISLNNKISRTNHTFGVFVSQKAGNGAFVWDYFQQRINPQFVNLDLRHYKTFCGSVKTFFTKIEKHIF